MLVRVEEPGLRKLLSSEEELEKTAKVEEGEGAWKSFVLPEVF